MNNNKTEILINLAKEAVVTDILVLEIDVEGNSHLLKRLLEMDGCCLNIENGQRFTLQNLISRGVPRTKLTLNPLVTNRINPEWFSQLHPIIEDVRIEKRSGFCYIA